MGAPIGRIHHRSRGGEMVRQCQRCRGAGGGDHRSNARPRGRGFRPVWIDNGGPDQTPQQHRQGQKNAAKNQLTGIIPATADHRQQKQAERENGGQNAEEAEGLDLDHHQAQQHAAEHRHPQGDAEHSPPGAAGEIALVFLQTRQQRQQRHHQNSAVGQQSDKRQRDAGRHRAPGAVEHLVATVGTHRAAEVAQQSPPLEGDRAGVDHTDGGEHRHGDAGPLGTGILTAATDQTGGAHPFLSSG